MRLIKLKPLLTSRQMAARNLITKLYYDIETPFHISTMARSVLINKRPHTGLRSLFCSYRQDSLDKQPRDSINCDFSFIPRRNPLVPRLQSHPRYFGSSTRLDWPQNRKYTQTLHGNTVGMAPKEVNLKGKENGGASIPFVDFEIDKNKEVAPPSRTPSDEMFNDHNMVYASKSAWELGRTMFFFFLFQFEVFASRSQEVMDLMRKVLGERLSDFLLKKFIYDQFVAGETTQEIEQVVRRLQAEGIGPLIAVPIEDDVGTTPAGSAGSSPEAKIDKNLEEILKCMDLCMKVSGSNPMFQLKMTALMSPALTKALSVACSQNSDENGDALCLDSVRTFVRGMRGQTIEIPRIKEWEKFSAAELEELERVLKRFRIINEMT